MGRSSLYGSLVKVREVTALPYDPCREFDKATIKPRKQDNGQEARARSENIEKEVLDGSSTTIFLASHKDTIKPVIDHCWEWSIDSLLFGDGYQHNTKLLTKGKWYRSSTPHGGSDAYYCLSEITFSIHEGPTKATLVFNKLIHPMTKAVLCDLVLPGVSKTRSASRVLPSVILKEAILVLCRNFTGWLRCWGPCKPQFASIPWLSLSNAEGS